MQISGSGNRSSCELVGDKREWEREKVAESVRGVQLRIIWCVKQGTAFEGALKCQILCPPAWQDACGWQRVMCAPLPADILALRKEKHTRTFARVYGTKNAPVTYYFNQMPN